MINLPQILMDSNEQLEQLADKLTPTTENMRQVDDTVKELSKILDENDEFAVPKIWKSSILNSGTEVGKNNLFDAVALIQTAISDQNIVSMFEDHLDDYATETIQNQGVKVEINDTKFHVLPTKFASQGTIGLDKEGPLFFKDVIGQGDLFENTSRLLQKWQFNSGLDLESEALLPFEIEVTLAHVFSENEPKTLVEALEGFFEFAKRERFSSQINIFDKHGNVLLYHIFNIPKKLDYLLKAEETQKQLQQNPPVLSSFQ